MAIHKEPDIPGQGNVGNFIGLAVNQRQTNSIQRHEQLHIDNFKVTALENATFVPKLNVFTTLNNKLTLWLLYTDFMKSYTLLFVF